MREKQKERRAREERERDEEKEERGDLNLEHKVNEPPLEGRESEGGDEMRERKLKYETLGKMRKPQRACSEPAMDILNDETISRFTLSFD